ncbi:MAG: O-antigen ligase family protein [Rhodospirillaceae bacterium]|nr:O-antigen ligase family protein [Rhodospirillaceae bacterium]
MTPAVTGRPFRIVLLSAAIAVLLGLGFLMHRNYFYQIAWYVLVLAPAAFVVRVPYLVALLRSWIVLFTLLYAAVFAVGVLWSPDPTLDWMFGQGWKCLSLALFMAIAATAFARDGGMEARFATFYVPAAAVGGLFAIVRHLADTPIDRLSGVGQLLPTIIVGQAFAIASLIATMAAWKWVKQPYLRIACLICALVCAFVVLLTQSRGPLLALGMAIAVLALAMPGKRGLRILLMLGGGVCVVGLLFVFANWQSLLERSDNYRFEIWRTYLQMALERPWLGYGVGDVPIEIGTGQMFEHTHNAFLTAQIHGGITALIAITGLFAASAWVAWRRYRDHQDPFAAALLVCVFVASQFDRFNLVSNAGWQWLTFWFPFAILAAYELRLRDPGTRAAGGEGRND